MSEQSVYGTLLGFLLLDESIGPAHVIGGLLIIGGGLWAALGDLTQTGANGTVETKLRARQSSRDR